MIFLDLRRIITERASRDPAFLMIKWQEIDTVLLDMDGTLLDLHYDNHFWLEYLPRAYAEAKKLSLDHAHAELDALSRSLHGSLDWYCVDYWSERLQMDIESLKQDTSHLIRLRPCSLAFLEHLQTLGKEAIMVTNAHPKVLELKMASSSLGPYMKKMISSHEFMLAKENTGFWHKLQAREGLDLARCLFIDDSPNVLLCARAEGLGHLLQILQPDTTRPPKPAGDFPAIHDFDELMQITNEQQAQQGRQA